jgi:hypothetical protein
VLGRTYDNPLGDSFLRFSVDCSPGGPFSPHWTPDEELRELVSTAGVEIRHKPITALHHETSWVLLP